MANAFPSRLVDSVNGLIGKVKLLILKTVTFNIITPSLLEFKDQDGGLLDSVNVGIENVEDLSNKLDNELKTIQIPISETSLTVNSTEVEVQSEIANWLTLNGFAKLDIDTISWETVGDIIIVTNGYVESGYVSTGYVSNSTPLISNGYVETGYVQPNYVS